MSLRLCRRAKSPYWIARGTVAGCRVEKSTGTADRRQAEEFRAKYEAELYRQGVYGRSVSKTFAQAAVSYLEEGKSSRGRFLGKPLDHFGTKLLAEITLDDILSGRLRDKDVSGGR